MKMTIEVAKQLVESLKNCPGIIPIDLINKIKFIELLTSVDINSASKKFYIELPDDDKYQQLLQESRKYYYLSIRRILINKNADYYVSIVKKVWNNLVVHRIWSSNVFSRSLRLNEKIAKFLVENKSPFSLLAKLQVYNYDNKDEVLFVESKPILVVPGARGEDVEMIIKWEGENTLYEEEVGFFPFRYLKRISLKKYISCS